MSYERQGKRFHISLKDLTRLDDTLASKKRREILYAVDESNQIHSVAYLVWDETCAYYLMAGDDPEFRKSGAGILTAWHCIRYASNVLRLRQFDFLGSMIPAIARVRRQMGAKPYPYFLIKKYPTWKGKLYHAARTMVKG